MGLKYLSHASVCSLGLRGCCLKLGEASWSSALLVGSVNVTVVEWVSLLRNVTFELCYAPPMARQKPRNLSQSVNAVEDPCRIVGTACLEERLLVCKKSVIVWWWCCSTHAGSGLLHCVGEWYYWSPKPRQRHPGDVRNPTTPV